MNPELIESESFRIVQEGLRKKGQEGLLQGPKGAILARVIHATADFSFADTLLISEGAAEKGVLALQQGSPVIVDVEMVRAGINKKGLQDLGGEVRCFMADEDVAKKAKALGTTRAAIAMQKAAELSQTRSMRLETPQRRSLSSSGLPWRARQGPPSLSASLWDSSWRQSRKSKRSRCLPLACP